MRIGKKLKKALSILAAAALSLSLLTACGSISDKLKGKTTADSTPSNDESSKNNDNRDNSGENNEGSNSGNENPGGNSGGENPDGNNGGTDENPGGNNNENEGEGSGTNENTEENNGIIPKETLTLTVYSERTGNFGEQTGWFAKILKDRFNIKLEILPAGYDSFKAGKENGNLADILVLCEEDYKEARDAGCLLDWEKDGLLDEYGEYIKDHAGVVLEKNRSMSDDGSITGLGYYFGSINDKTDTFYTWDIRWDLYEKLGHSDVKNLEDLYELFKKMKEICPTDEAGNPVYAFSLWSEWDMDMHNNVRAAISAYYGYDESGLGLYDPKTGKFYGVLDDGSHYVEMLAFFNKLYREGLLDPDSVTATYDTMVEKVKKGGVFCSVCNFSGSGEYNTKEHTEKNQIMKPLIAAEASPIAYGLHSFGEEYYFAIGAKTENPELCMAIINYLTTPTGRLESEYGPMDITWFYDDEGYTCFTELGEKCIKDYNTDLSQSGYEGTMREGESLINCVTWNKDAVNTDSKQGETYNYQNWHSEAGDPVNDAEKDWREFNGVTSDSEYLNKCNYTLSVVSGYRSEKLPEEISYTWDQVTWCIKENSWKAIYAKDDADFNKIVEEMKSLAYQFGYQECIDWSAEEAAKRTSAVEKLKEMAK